MTSLDPRKPSGGPSGHSLSILLRPIHIPATQVQGPKQDDRGHQSLHGKQLTANDSVYRPCSQETLLSSGDSRGCDLKTPSLKIHRQMSDESLRTMVLVQEEHMITGTGSGLYRACIQHTPRAYTACKRRTFAGSRTSCWL